MVSRLLLSSVMFLGVTIISGVTHGDSGIQYSTQIAPILRTYCVGCHSRVDSQNGLSLQAPDDILKGSENGRVINPAAPKESRLLQVLTSNGDGQMPPADEPQPSTEERALLIEWLENGSPFDSRMAVLPALPKVRVTASQKRDVSYAVAISSDGSSVLSGKFKAVEQRSTDQGELQWRFPVSDGKVNDLQISRDGKRLLLATGTPGLAGRAVEVKIGETAAHREFAGHHDILYAATWSPDERIVATAGYDRRILLHDAETGKTLRELTGHNGAIFDLEFSPDGTLLASASADATIKIWDAASGARFDTLSQPQSEQYAVVFSPDGQFIYGAGGDSRIRQWQLLSRTAPQINPLLIARFAHEGAITKLKASSDGRFLVTASEAGAVKFWRADRVLELAAAPLNNDLVSSLAFHPSAENLLIATARGDQKLMPLPLISDEAPTASVAQPQMAAVSDVAVQNLAESEPNDDCSQAHKVTFPSTISGTIDSDDPNHPDIDSFQFDLRKGQQVLIEVRAERDKSSLDSSVTVTDLQGTPILQTQLQAVRDSYFTFRGKDSDTSDDFRMFNWQEMELNEYLYADGEVVKLWLYPRGPDSGFKVYPGFGNRQTYFGTTATSHPLQGPAFVVIPHDASAVLKSTGLPVFPIFYENDDDPMRQWGKDSRLPFVAPADGTYVVRIRDARGFQGADYKYQLLLRSPQPDFSVAMAGTELAIHPGTGREISFTATRLDGYDGPIEIYATNLPPGFSISDPIVIQQEQRQAFATLIASSDAVQPTAEQVSEIRFEARTQIAGNEITHAIGGIKSLKLAEKPKILVRIQTVDQHSSGQIEQTPELTVWAGETVRAILKVERLNHAGLVEFGKEDSGRNLPHGVFVDNIGLNGLMLLAGQDEREIFITTAKWVPETSRPFYLKSNIDGGITSLPVMLHVRHRSREEVRTVETR